MDPNELKAKRKEKGWSQLELGQKLGLSSPQSSVSRLELGKDPLTPHLAKLREVFGGKTSDAPAQTLAPVKPIPVKAPPSPAPVPVALPGPAPRPTTSSFNDGQAVRHKPTGRVGKVRDWEHTGKPRVVVDLGGVSYPVWPEDECESIA